MDLSLLRRFLRPGPNDRILFSGCYLLVATSLNILWELAQLPFYTIWRDSPIRDSLFAAVHCTAGDVVIAALVLAFAVLLMGRNWPQDNYLKVAVLAVILGVAYTIFSEWLNVEVRRTWAYVPAMLRLPWVGTGLAPLAQWIVVPSAAFFLLRRRASAASRSN
jgi:hypothetical protein